MTTVVQNLTADQWFDRWRWFAGERKRLGEHVQNIQQEAREAGGCFTTDGRSLYDHADVLLRDLEIVRARTELAWIYYVITKYDLVPEDVFDVGP